MQGTIKKLVTDKNFGFISQGEGKNDVFFHANECKKDFSELREGDAVTFEIADTPKGPSAKEVEKV